MILKKTFTSNFDVSRWSTHVGREWEYHHSPGVNGDFQEMIAGHKYQMSCYETLLAGQVGKIGIVLEARDLGYWNDGNDLIISAY